VVLPASGWEMMAKVLRRLISLTISASFTGHFPKRCWRGAHDTTFGNGSAEAQQDYSRAARSGSSPLCDGAPTAYGQFSDGLYRGLPACCHKVMHSLVTNGPGIFVSIMGMAKSFNASLR
jgi:hypothetical protein